MEHHPPSTPDTPAARATLGAPARHVWQVIVIGAGQAGLATAHDLVRRGLVPGRDVLVLDAGEGPGGAWRERWDSLTLGRAHAVADLPGLPLGTAAPTVPASRVVGDYFHRYEQRFGLRVLRPARVRSVSATRLSAPALSGIDEGDPGAALDDVALRTGGGVVVGGSPTDAGNLDAIPHHPRSGDAIPRDTLLAVDVDVAPRIGVDAGAGAGAGTGAAGLATTVPANDGDWTRPGRHRLLTRMVVSATGTWTHPYIPWVPGAPEFRGRQLHTVDFARVEDFAGQKVLVVGGGLSAVQFLLELAPVAETVWATRRPPNFTDVTFDQVWGAEVERAVDDLTGRGLPPASVVRTTGIPREPAYLRGIARGVLISRGMFDRIGPHGVRFSPAATSQDPAGRGPATPSGTGLVEPDSWDPYPRPTWVDVDVIFWNTGFRAATGHLAPLRLRDPGTRGITMAGRVSVARDPRVLLVGYGSSASTSGATRAGRKAARVALRRLGPVRTGR